LDLPKRKDMRLTDYDYSQNGAYFVTICTLGRQNLFGTVVGDGFPVPFAVLNHHGEIIKQHIRAIPDRYATVTVGNYIVMPNHIHLLVMITKDCASGTGNPSPTLGTVVGWFKYQTTKAINAHAGNAGVKIWQRSYHDHVIRNEDDYLRISQYIDENPAKWREDRYYVSDD